jgi:hypothetical protein
MHRFANDINGEVNRKQLKIGCHALFTDEAVCDADDKIAVIVYWRIVKQKKIENVINFRYKVALHAVETVRN